MPLRCLPLVLLCAATPLFAQTAHIPATGAGDVNLPLTSIRQARLAGQQAQGQAAGAGAAIEAA